MRWNWKKITEKILTDNLDLPEGKAEKDYTFSKPGFYTVTTTASDGLKNTITTRGHFYVTGSGYVSWGVNEGRTIELITDKTEYQTGQEIELLIKSPFQTSTALITVEREKVIWSKLVRMEGNARTVPIPVTESFMPNAFINVIILKERSGLKFDEEGKDLGKPEFYSGYKEIKVDASLHKLTLALKANQDSYEPGDDVEVARE